MNKFAVILGFVLSTPIFSGVAYMIGSQVAARSDSEARQESQMIYREMMDEVEMLHSHRRFDDAQMSARVAVDHAVTKQMRAAAGYQVGRMMFEEWRVGGDAPLDAAVAYLTAARNLSGSPRRRADIDLLLLDTLNAMGKTEKYSESIDELLETAVAFDEEIALWQRRFDFLLGEHGDWGRVNAVLEEARGINVDWAEWKDLLADVHLRIDERVFENPEWFAAYMEAHPETDPTVFRNELFVQSRSKLQALSVNADEQMREDAVLRLARLQLAAEEYGSALNTLDQFVEMRPEQGVGEALELLSVIMANGRSGIQGQPLARSLTHLIDINALSQDGVVHVVDLLEQMQLYPEALGVLKSRLSLIATVSRNQGVLLARSAILQERLGNRGAAVEFMDRLQQMECSSDLGYALCDILEQNLLRGDYVAVEDWAEAYAGKLTIASAYRAEALYALYEAKYWQDRPVADQFFVGAAALGAAPESGEAQSVELRMAHAIEDISLYPLAISYYNRIGLLNFFQGDLTEGSASQNIGEQAVLGKARCLKKLGDWVASNQLYRNLCRRTRSPLVKSEAAVGWAEVALRENQQREALRRYNLVHVQLLSEADQVRYMLGRMQFDPTSHPRETAAMERSIEMLKDLPESEQLDATISFFNESVDYLCRENDEEAMLQLIDLAGRSGFSDSLPIASYILRMFDEVRSGGQIDLLATELHKFDGIAPASIGGLMQDMDRLKRVSDTVKGL